MRKLKVLIACEESQAVCKAFRELGHEAYSCDILPCSGGHPEWHIQGDVLEQLDKDWDLIIAHPPCTDLAVSGARHFKQKIAYGSQQKSIEFFMKFTNLKCPRVMIENPIGIMSTLYRKPDQIIQPYHFGHSVSKSTCLWLKGLPKLIPTNIVDKGKFFEWTDKKTGKKKRQALWYYEALRQKNTGGLRSKTFEGIAKAMAKQWSEYLEQLIATPYDSASQVVNDGLNISLKTTPTAPSKLPTATSLNNNINRNRGECL